MHISHSLVYFSLTVDIHAGFDILLCEHFHSVISTIYCVYIVLNSILVQIIIIFFFVCV